MSGHAGWLALSTDRQALYSQTKHAKKPLELASLLQGSQCMLPASRLSHGFARAQYACIVRRCGFVLISQMVR